MVRDAFGNRIIITKILIDCTIGMNNKKYRLSLTLFKPFSKDKVIQFILGISQGD